MVEKICGVACMLISLIALVISIRSFQEKGYLFNNAYIWASKQTRENINKKLYYRQTAVIFLIIALIFCCISIEFIFETYWMFFITTLLTIVGIVYAVKTSIKIEKMNKDVNQC